MSQFKLGDPITIPTCRFTIDQVVATGLTVNVSVYLITATDPNGALLTTGVAVHVAGGSYAYTLAGSLVTVAGTYLFDFVPTVTTDQDGARLAVSAGLGGVENLDAQISSIAQTVWEYSTRTLSSFGTLIANMVTAVWGNSTRTLTSASFTSVSGNVDTDGNMTLYQTADYEADDTTSFQWTLSNPPGNLASAVVTFKAQGQTVQGSISGAVVTLEITAAQTALFPAGTHKFQIFAQRTVGFGSRRSPLIVGDITVIKVIT